jgi:putative redox protein
MVMEAKVTWKGRMSFDASADSGFNVQLGTEPVVGGDNDGFKPMELILIGLGGCTAMDVISILTKMKQKVDSFEIKLHGDRSKEHPKVFTNITIEYILNGQGLDHAAVQRAVDLSAQRYCPAQAMIGKLLPIELKINIQNS